MRMSEHVWNWSRSVECAGSGTLTQETSQKWKISIWYTCIWQSQFCKQHFWNRQMTLVFYRERIDLKIKDNKMQRDWSHFICLKMLGIKGTKLREDNNLPSSFDWQKSETETRKYSCLMAPLRTFSVQRNYTAGSFAPSWHNMDMDAKLSLKKKRSTKAWPSLQLSPVYENSWSGENVKNVECAQQGRPVH